MSGMEITDARIEAVYSALVREGWLAPFAARAADYPVDEELFAAARDAEAKNRDSIRRALVAAGSEPNPKGTDNE